jgi:hypothetical protein
MRIRDLALNVSGGTSPQRDNFLAQAEMLGMRVGDPDSVIVADCHRRF